jgi:hypothetical protein
MALSLLLYARKIFRGGYYMKRVFLSLVGWTLISSLVGLATVAAAPRDGANEVQVSGGFFHAQDSDTGNLTIDLSYGYNLTPGWQVGFRQALNSIFVEDGSDQWSATTTPFINYHFRVTDIIVPYLGAFIGAVWNDRDITGTLGPQVGVKFFVHEQTFLNLGYRYEWFWDKFERIDNSADNGNHIFNIGVGFQWGGTGSTRRP